VRTLRREDIELSEAERTTFLEMIESGAPPVAHRRLILLAGQLDADAVELSVTQCNPAEIAAGVISRRPCTCLRGSRSAERRRSAIDHVREQARQVL
jgi:hypothetical protein